MIRVVAAKGLAVCEHRGLQFSIAWEMLEDPSRLREALAQSAPGLAHRLSLRVQGRQAEPPPPNGALSFPESGAYRLEDGGRAGLLLTWVFGARVYQALVQGPAGDLGLARQFHEGLSHPGVGDRPG